MPYEMNEGGYLSGDFVQAQYDRNQEWQDYQRSQAAAESYWRQLKMQQEMERSADLNKLNDALTADMVPLGAEVDEYGHKRVKLGYAKEAKPVAPDVHSVAGGLAVVGPDGQPTWYQSPWAGAEKPVKQYQVVQTKEGVSRFDPYSGTLESLSAFMPEADKDKQFAPHYEKDAQGNVWQIPSNGPAQQVQGPDGKPIVAPVRDDPSTVMAQTIQRQSMMMYLNEELRAVDDLGLPDEKRRQAARQQLQELYKSVNPQQVNARGFNAADFAASGTPTNSVTPNLNLTPPPTTGTNDWIEVAPGVRVRRKN